MSLVLGILATGNKPGIRDFSYLGTGAGALTWNNAPLGTPDRKRYIVVVCGYRTGTALNSTFNGCTIDGIALTQHASNRGTNASNQTTCVAVFGGYVPEGTTGTVVFTMSGASPGSTCDYSIHRMLGDNIQFLATHNGGASGVPIEVANEGVVVGVAESETGGTAVVWSGVDRNTEKDKGNWRYSSASRYYAIGGNPNMYADSTRRTFVSLYSP